ncbi:helix-turn-helix domain-containing protein [Agromyces sp. GXS1127]|uniref:helix-turn-helix domain-containing protein n=1 Tax=Agromyces sp. GXS1127 TaxID=3424181 RepID=UPI003D3192B7
MGETIEFPARTVETAPRSRPLWRDVLGEVLRDERREQERILTEVARTAGVSPQYLSEIERGRKEASSELLSAVVDALGLELVDVVGRVAGRLSERSAREAETARRRARLLDLTASRDATAPFAPVTAPSPATAPPGAYLLAA